MTDAVSEPGRYLKSITFSEDHRDFKKGEHFEFWAGINFLVGDQGAGKSTLLAELRRHVTRKGLSVADKAPCTTVERGPLTVPVLARDFEKENVRVLPGFGMVAGVDDATHIAALYASHGEFVRMQLQSLDQLGTKPFLLLFDEPDGALSLRSICMLRDLFLKLAARGVQIIASVHHPWLIEAVPEVLSLEHRCWMESAVFIEAMKQPRPVEPAKPTPRRKSRT